MISVKPINAQLFTFASIETTAGAEMTSRATSTYDELTALRWGGFAGMLGSLLLLTVFAFLSILGMVDALVVTGLVLVPIGMVFLGLAMMGTLAYGKALGWMTVVFGLAGIVAAVMILIEPSELAAVGIFALILFNMIVGWRTFSLTISDLPDADK